jgi:hypothetical protein
VKEKSALWDLGRLQNFSFLKGSLIHEAINEQIKHHRLGRPVSSLAAKNFYLYKIGQVRKKQETFLVEAFNGYPIQEEKFDHATEDGLRQLDLFFKIIWHNYAGLQYINHEELESFLVGDIKVWVKLDLLSRNKDGHIVITDWKTGMIESEGELQGEIYTLWVKTRFNLPADQIVIEFVYLREPSIIQGRHTEEKLKECESRIILSAREILNMEKEEDFVASPEESKCLHCNFATICPERKKL